MGYLKTISLLTYFFLISSLSYAQSNQQDVSLIISGVVNKENKAELDSYLTKMSQIFKENQGVPVAKYKTIKVLKGENSPELVAIINFPSEEVVSKMIKGEAFQGLNDIRARLFSQLNIVMSSKL